MLDCTCLSVAIWASQPNTHSILAYSQLLFTMKQAEKHPSCPCKGLLATYHHISVADVEHSWGALKSSLTTTAQTQLKQAPKPQRAWTSEAMLHQAERKCKLWHTNLANPTSQSKAEYKAASRAPHKSAFVDRIQHFTSMLTKVQWSMRKGKIHSPQSAQAAQ